MQKADFRAGLICSVLANINRDRKVRPQPYSPADFIPGKPKHQKPKTCQEQLAIVEALNKAFGGEDLRI
ncbi:hypothetical protein N752_29075 [Desulforamulus aquiferis]|nr:hypothetical protein [Desulforamulus aquiferis]RYD01632.1 hypothetical protein N752_29075 [Desulforamulus aquiferis]